MNEVEITRYLCDTFHDVQHQYVDGTTFFFCGVERMFPFVTLVTNNAHDSFSALDRPDIFRLNIGISKQIYLALFGISMSRAQAEGGDEPPYDFTRLDHLMPHPVYGRMYWVCILNPGRATFDTQLKPLLDEAYQMTVSKQSTRTERA